MEDETQTRVSWQNLRNPFNTMDTLDMVTGHVSGRSTDIAQIISGKQSAIILAGAPYIGKSTLIRYLQLPPEAQWSWRNELAEYPDQQQLKDTQFVQIDLKDLEGIENKDALLAAFIERCALALQSVYAKGKHTSEELNLKGLIKILRTISEETPHVRYFLMLDTIERLGSFGLQTFKLETKAQTQQERGLALLDHCNAIRTLVDLIDEFRTFGFILSIESLPRAKVADQFTHVSADLARFSTMTLQTFTWPDADKFLAQAPESFGAEWAKSAKALDINCIFSQKEQAWLQELAGTHPYILQQSCLYAFHLKQEYAKLHGSWLELQESGKRQLVDRVNERLSTFFAHAWNRLQEALQSSAQAKEKTQRDFREFMQILTQKQVHDTLDLAHWEQWGPELRYILYSEGIIRYDLFQPIYLPGTFLRSHLIQRARASGDLVISPIIPSTTSRGYWLNITHPDNQQDHLSLSELEYHLLNTLLQNPKHCSEFELMMGAWGKKIERPTFTQRMHHLRKKLKDQCGVEIIENRYGGIYSLNHREWLKLD